jgi:hypothetical protein
MKGPKENNLQYKQNLPAVFPSGRAMSRRAAKFDGKMKFASILSIIKGL